MSARQSASAEPETAELIHTLLTDLNQERAEQALSALAQNVSPDVAEAATESAFHQLQVVCERARRKLRKAQIARNAALTMPVAKPSYSCEASKRKEVTTPTTIEELELVLPVLQDVVAVRAPWKPKAQVPLPNSAQPSWSEKSIEPCIRFARRSPLNMLASGRQRRFVLHACYPLFAIVDAEPGQRTVLKDEFDQVMAPAKSAGGMRR